MAPALGTRSLGRALAVVVAAVLLYLHAAALRGCDLATVGSASAVSAHQGYGYFDSCAMQRGVSHALIKARTKMVGSWWDKPATDVDRLLNLLDASAAGYFDQRSSHDLETLADLARRPSHATPSEKQETRLEREHILVTGGFGSLGKSVVRELVASQLVTILDVRDRTAELDFVLNAHSPAIERTATSDLAATGQLRIVIGDVRNGTLVGDVLNRADETLPPVTGIVHLAAYSPRACRLNQVDCTSVEEAGMMQLLKATKRVATGRRPWLLVPRRAEGWPEHSNITSYGASRQACERAKRRLQAFAAKEPLHAALLNLPSADSIVGDTFSSRLTPVPYMIEAALGDQPIIPVPGLVDGLTSVDELALAIAETAAIMQYAARLVCLGRLAFVSELSVTAQAADAYSIAEQIIAMTRSSSPLAIRVASTAAVPSSEPSVGFATAPESLSRVTGFTSRLSWVAALDVHLSRLLKRHREHVHARMAGDCHTPDVPTLEAGLLALNGSTVQLLSVLDGRWHALGCSIDQGGWSQPLALMPAIMYDKGIRVVKLVTRRNADGQVEIQMRCALPLIDGWGHTLAQKAEPIAWAYTSGRPGDSDRREEFVVILEDAEDDSKLISRWFTVDFVDASLRTMTIALPRDGKPQSRYLATQKAGRKKLPLGFRADGDAVRWRINPVCAASTETPWDYFAEDPLYTSAIAFPDGTGRASFQRSVLLNERCGAMRAQLERLDTLAQSSGSPRHPSGMERGDAVEWVAKDRGICHVDCTAPVKCVATEHCRCARDRCEDSSADGPFPRVIYSDDLSFGAAHLPKVARAPSIDQLVLPAARSAFARRHEDLPKAHVVELPKSIDTHDQSEACTKLGEAPLAYLSDHILTEAFRKRSVPAQDADFVLLPFYQACYTAYQKEQDPQDKLDASFHYAQQMLGDRLTSGDIAIPFFHDFGSCTGNWPTFENATASWVHGPPQTDFAIAWQAMGDVSTRCIKPDRDIVLPATSRHNNALVMAYRDPQKVVPVLYRPTFAYFAGGARGFGSLVRTRLACGSTITEPSSRIHYQTYSWREDAPDADKTAQYLKMLGQSRFCLLPRGIPAWTTRTFGAIYAGCIPVFLADRNIYPYQDVLDYSRFSLTIPETEAHRVEEILGAISDDHLVALQSALLAVREAFTFDEGHEWERRGPFFFALVSMAMRLRLRYPRTSPLC